VESDLPDGSTLVDSSTGAEIPVEILYKGKGISLPGFGPGSVRVRFLAAAVPAVGYKPVSYTHLDIIVGGKMQYKNGAMAVPTGPGLGVEIDHDKLARCV